MSQFTMDHSKATQQDPYPYIPCPLNQLTCSLLMFSFSSTSEDISATTGGRECSWQLVRVRYRRRERPQKEAGRLLKKAPHRFPARLSSSCRAHGREGI